MPSVAFCLSLDFLLTRQLFHPLLFSGGLLRHVPFLGLAAFAQGVHQVTKRVPVDPICRGPQPRGQIVRSLPLWGLGLPSGVVSQSFRFGGAPNMPGL